MGQRVPDSWPVTKRVVPIKIPPANATLLVLDWGHASQFLFDRTTTSIEQAFQQAAEKWHKNEPFNMSEFTLVDEYSVKSGVNAHYSEVVHYAHTSTEKPQTQFAESWFLTKKITQV